jgi:hypothetical protein
MSPFRVSAGPLLCLWCALALTVCGGRASMGGEILTLYVAPERRECVGVVVQQCLLVRKSPGAEWELFYDTIQGFDYKPGFHYALRVERRRVADPPQDSSAYEWRLIEVLEQRPA